MTEISWRPWEGGRYVLKHLLTDRGLRFASWHDAHQGPSGESSPLAALVEGEARITAPSGLAESMVKKYATLFGAFTAFTAYQASMQFGQS